jgi:hypothetical protein
MGFSLLHYALDGREQSFSPLFCWMVAFVDPWYRR